MSHLVPLCKGGLKIMNIDYKIKKEHFKMEVQNEKMQIISGIFLMFSKGKIAKEELDKVIAIENDLSTLEIKNKENQ